MYKYLLYKIKNGQLINKSDIEQVENKLKNLDNESINKYKLDILQKCLEHKYSETSIRVKHLNRNIVMISYWLNISKNDYIYLLNKTISSNKRFIDKISSESIKKENKKSSSTNKLNQNDFGVREKDLNKIDINIDKGIENLGFSVANVKSACVYSDNIVFGGSRGHGFAAEKMNNMYDQFMGKDATIIGDDYKLNGADRLVNGVQIQTKYCKTGSKCIAECFKDGKMKYLNPENTPMQIEVPSDKYESAVQAMENRIKTGQVPGVTDLGEARKIVKKGKFTYEQAKNVAKFGKIESLTYDAINGVKIAGTSMGISSVLTFACSVWNGDDLDIALERAIDTGIKIGGVSFISSVVTSQLGRTSIEQGLRPATDYLVSQIGNKATANIVNSLRVGSKPIYGAAASNNLSKMMRGNFVANTATVAILSTVDITRLVKGEISSGQAFKNISTTVAGVAGGTVGYTGGSIVGGAIGSVIPIVGTAAGAFVGGMIGAIATGNASSTISRNALDSVIEDDGAKMLQIIEKNFEKIAFDYLLNSDEIKKVSGKLQDINLEKEMRMMYACNDRDLYAYNLIVNIAKDLVKKRKFINLPSDKQILIYLGN